MPSPSTLPSCEPASPTRRHRQRRLSLRGSALMLPWSRPQNYDGHCTPAHGTYRGYLDGCRCLWCDHPEHRELEAARQRADEKTNPKTRHAQRERCSAPARSVLRQVIALWRWPTGHAGNRNRLPIRCSGRCPGSTPSTATMVHPGALLPATTSVVAKWSASEVRRGLMTACRVFLASGNHRGCP